MINLYCSLRCKFPEGNLHGWHFGVSQSSIEVKQDRDGSRRLVRTHAFIHLMYGGSGLCLCVYVRFVVVTCTNEANICVERVERERER
jgi:hypothetical protein